MPTSMTSSLPTQIPMSTSSIYGRYFSVSISTESPQTPRNATLVRQKLAFLGYRIDEHDISPLPEKTQSIVDYSVLQSVKGLRRFLGMVNYYRRFIHYCTQILLPLTDLLKCNPRHFTMTPEAEAAFATMKQHLSNATKLRYLSTSSEAQIVLKTDPSQVAVGAVLQQIVNVETQLLLFFSRKLKPAETRKSTPGRELLAIYSAVRHFRHILEGRQFTIFTDHKRLVYAFRAPADRHSSREIRQLDFILQFTSDIRYIEGKNNAVADALSRKELGHIAATPTNFQGLAENQESDPEFAEITVNPSLRFACLPLITCAGLITFTTQLEPREYPQPNEVIQFLKLSKLKTSNVEDNFRCRSSRIWNSLKCPFSNQIHDVIWVVHSTFRFAGTKVRKAI